MAIRWYDVSHRDADMGRVVQHLLMSGGLATVTMRAVARTARMALGTLGNHYGSKDQVLMAAAGEIGRLHVDDLVLQRSAACDLESRLADMAPRDAEEVLDLKVWQDLVTAGRSSHGVGEVVAHVEARHRDLLRYTLAGHRDPEWADRHLEAVWVVLQGIRCELIRPGTRLDPAGADLLCARAAAAAEALVGPGADSSTVRS